MFMKVFLAAVAALCTTASAAAGEWPDRPVHIVVPFSPGGNVDIAARIVGAGLAEELKQTVVIENKPGANAAIGAEFVARAAPDGYVLLLGTAESLALNPHLRKSLPYDPAKDFSAIGVLDRFPFSIVVSPKLKVANLEDFIAYARENAGRLNFASWGNGSTSQIAFEQIKQKTGIELVHIPFQGAAPAIAAVSAGDVQAFVVPLSVALPQAKAGRVKLLAVISDKRDESAPEIPTATEQGVPVVISGWHVLAAPSATPQKVLEILNRALNAVAEKADIQERMRKLGVTPVQSTIRETQDMVRAESQRWGGVARKAGIVAN